MEGHKSGTKNSGYCYSCNGRKYRGTLFTGHDVHLTNIPYQLVQEQNVLAKVE